MALAELLRELPLFDDLADFADLAEVIGEWFVPGPTTSDYEALRGEMYWTDVGDTGQSTREHLLEKFSLEPVTRNEAGQVISGFWCDPHTNFTSANPEDWDIDHRVPFSKVVELFPNIYDLPREEQLTIYNDVENLQVSHDLHNAAKGAQSPADHAATFGDEAARREFLDQCRNYIEKLKAHLPS